MIIDEKFGIIIFFAQAPYILNSGQKNLKARSMTTLFQLMQTDEHKEKTLQICSKSKYGLNFQELYNNHLAESEKKRESWVPKANNGW